MSIDNVCIRSMEPEVFRLLVQDPSSNFGTCALMRHCAVCVLLFTKRSCPACKHRHNYPNEHQVYDLYFEYKCCFHRPWFCTCTNFLNGSWTSNLKTSVSNQAQRQSGLRMKLEWPGNEGGVAWERG